jgi:hypothetical protein
VRDLKALPCRVFEVRDADVHAVAPQHPATDDERVVRLCPPIALDDRIGRSLGKDLRLHIGAEARVVECRLAELQLAHQPLRFKRPVRFA